MRWCVLAAIVLTAALSSSRTAPANTTAELVAHGQVVQMLLRAELPPESQDRMKKLSEDGIVFAACGSTMKIKGIRCEDLLPFVKTVDSAIAKVVRKQEAGWSYIKAGS